MDRKERARLAGEGLFRNCTVSRERHLGIGRNKRMSLLKAKVMSTFREEREKAHADMIDFVARVKRVPDWRLITPSGSIHEEVTTRD